MLLEINKLEKYYGQAKILQLDKFILNRGDKVAIVGANGAGKTTLLKLISMQTEPNGGSVSVRGSIGIVPQFYRPGNSSIDYSISGKMRLDTDVVHSGGEQTKHSIAQAFSQPYDILLADEPTTNLDIEAIYELEKLLRSYKGGLVLVSHDTELLKNVCGKVLEIERGLCTLYNCGYADYINQKAIAETAHAAKYEAYITEKKRLKKAAMVKAQKSAAIKRAPKRMGNSEARLHKMGGQREKAKIDSAAKAAVMRLEKLGKVEKPWKDKKIVFDVKPGAVHNKVLVDVHDVSKAYGDKTILEGCSFFIPNGKKTALLGANGTGKTTLIDMIASREEGVKVCKNVKTGYFYQDIRNLDNKKSVLENAMQDTIHSRYFVRTILSRLLFKREQVNKSAAVLSGGERIRLSLAKIILSNFNLLILDEPTNFLDIESKQALEDVLCAYPGAVLFVSHDREFVRSIADRIVYIKNKKTYTFEGGYDDFDKARE